MKVVINDSGRSIGTWQGLYGKEVETLQFKFYVNQAQITSFISHMRARFDYHFFDCVTYLDGRRYVMFASHAY